MSLDLMGLVSHRDPPTVYLCCGPRKTGQSSLQRDMRENSSSQETKEQNESPAAPSRSPDLPKMRDDACDPSPDLLLHSLRFSLSLHSSARSLPLGRRSLVSIPVVGVRRFVSMALSEARADVSSALPGCRTCRPAFISCRLRESRR